MKCNESVTEYIQAALPEQLEIMETLRQLIHSTIPETKEEVKWGIPIFIKTMIFTYLRCSKHHVALGFYNIDRINDPNGLLEGTGKTMRHLKFKRVEEVDNQLIAKWLKATAK
jgi:hypothetical protein